MIALVVHNGATAIAAVVLFLVSVGVARYRAWKYRTGRW